MNRVHKPEIQRLSVIIPSRGRSCKLGVLLDTIDQLKDATNTAFEVILVIDGEGEAPRGQWSYPLQIIHTTHIGAGPARNLGIEAAKGDAILFLNDDVIPEPGFFDAHVGGLNRGNDAVLGYSPWIEPQSPTIFDGFIKYTPAIFDQGGLVDGQSYGFGFGWTLNLSVRRSVIDGLDFAFDPELRPIYFEDIEFAHRCFGASQEVYFCKAARAVHDHRVTPHEYFAREVLLGMMSVVLNERNRECFDALFPCSPAEHIRAIGSVFKLDERDYTRVLARFMSLAQQPADEPNLIDQAWMLYDLHLSIKRRAFRLGLSAMVQKPIPWDQRIAAAHRLLTQDPVFCALESGR